MEMTKSRFSQIKWISKDKPSWEVIGKKVGSETITEEDYISVYKSKTFDDWLKQNT